MFIHLERDKVRVGEGQREGETKIPKQAPDSGMSAHSLRWGSKPQTLDHKPSQSHTLNVLSHPGAANHFF